MKEARKRRKKRSKEQGARSKEQGARRRESSEDDYPMSRKESSLYKACSSPAITRSSSLPPTCCPAPHMPPAWLQE
eukprot:739254-Hanusia_phi.AAC.1